MTTPPTLPPPPTIPLTDAVRASYEDLYKKLQTQLQATTDPGDYDSFDDARDEVDEILTQDTEYRLHADTAAFTQLQEQIKDTNAELKTLQAEILSIAAKIAMYGDVLAAITKVLKLVG